MRLSVRQKTNQRMTLIQQQHSCVSFNKTCTLLLSRNGLSLLCEFLCKFSINKSAKTPLPRENTEHISIESNEFTNNFKCVLSLLLTQSIEKQTIIPPQNTPLTSVKSSFSSITFMNHLPVLFVRREFRNQK